jgi:hypothetical protein
MDVVNAVNVLAVLYEIHHLLLVLHFILRLKYSYASYTTTRR